MSSTPVQPVLTDYLDFRLFLRDWYQSRKAVESWLTHRLLAQKFGLGSHSHFGEVLRGRKLSPDYLERYQKMLGLDAQDRKRFALLVEYQQCGDSALSLKLFAKLKKAGFGPAQEDVQEIAKDFFADPLHPVLFNLCAAYPHVREPMELAALLRQRFSISRVRDALAFLQKAAFLRWNESPSAKGEGIWQHESGHLRFASQGSKHLTAYQHGMLQWGIKAFEEDEDSQHLGMLTLSLSQEMLLEVRRRLRAFRQEIVALSQKDTVPERTIHLNLQLLELDREVRTPSTENS